MRTYGTRPILDSRREILRETAQGESFTCQPCMVVLQCTTRRKQGRRTGYATATSQLQSTVTGLVMCQVHGP